MRFIRQEKDVLQVGVIALTRVTSGGSRDTSRVPPGPIVKVSSPMATVTVTIGMGIIVVELERTKVSDPAVGGGYGFGSIDGPGEIGLYRIRRKAYST